MTVATAVVGSIGIIDLEAAKRGSRLERDSADGIRVLPGKVDHLLYLVAVEAIIEGDGERRGQFDTLECGDGFDTHVPQIFAAELEDIL